MPRKKPERNKNPTQPAGDYVLDPKEFRDPEAQPLSAREKELVRRAYALYRHFADRLRPVHEAMHDARAMRNLCQPQRSGTSAAMNTLNSCIDNVIADQIDNMPEARMAPEREETAQSAEELTDVVSYILYHAGWPGKYQKIMEDAVVTGTGIAEVFWDDESEDGDGMVNVLHWHPEDFYPDPMYENIQDGRGIFKVTQTTVAWVEEHYPYAAGYVSGSTEGTELERDLSEAPDGDVRTTLLEFWYKRYDAKKRKNRVHMAMLAGGALLFSTETGYGIEGGEGEYREGIYAHGMYPFTVFKYRDVFRTPFGTGLVHDYKDTQQAIDRYQKYIDDNARESSVQRHFIRRGSGVNTEDLANYNRTVIEWDGNDIREVMQTIQAAPLNNQVFQNMQYLVDTMKQDSGQNQFNRGEGGLGVTAAAGIVALQEAGGKITRWHTEAFKDAFREMVEQIIWVLSEYMPADRKLRIVGGWDNTENMENRLIELSAPKFEGDEMLKPAYFVRVQVQKNNPMQNQAHNEFVQNVTQVCAQYGKPLPPEVVVRLMRDVPNKQAILKAIAQSGTMQDEIANLQAQLEQAQMQIQGRDAVIDSQAKALGTPSIAQGGADYSSLVQPTEEQPTM
jgi:hypothetical protein